jgi:hypothetical protein
VRIAAVALHLIEVKRQSLIEQEKVRRHVRPLLCQLLEDFSPLLVNLLNRSRKALAALRVRWGDNQVTSVRGDR